MKKKLMVVVFCLAFFGCQKEISQETGEKVYRIDPVKSKQVEQGVEGAASLLNALAPFWPPAAGVAGTALAALGIWKKKIKPNYIEAQSEAKLYHTSMATLVAIIEDLKESQPEAWAKLKPMLESDIGQNVENAIRALRGLPPKE